MKDVVVVINQAPHPIASVRAAALIDFIAMHQDDFEHDSGKLLLNYKGNSLTIEPSYVEHIEIKTVAAR